MPYPVGLAGGGTGYFIDNNSNPILVYGDEVWALPCNAGRWTSGNYQGDYDTFFANRAGQGFNAVLITPLGSTFVGGANNNGLTWDSVAPFVSSGNPSTGLNSTFWTRIDYMLSSALSNNITIIFNFGGQWDLNSSGGAMNGKSTTEFQAYGNKVATRYLSQPNIIWMVEDDYFGSIDSQLDSLLTGIQAAGDTRIISAQNMAESTSRFTLDASPSTCAWGNTNGDFNWVYTYNQEYYGVERAYAEASPIPVLWGDGYFYQGNNVYSGGTGAFAYDRAFRQATWWALASGARGRVHGAEDIWQWASSALASSSTDWYHVNNAAHIRTYVESLPGWYNLIPDTGSALVTGGRGTRASAFASGGGGGQYDVSFSSAYVGASVTADKSLALLYLPKGTTITIDQSKIAAGYTATWVDPITCATTAAATGTTYNSTAKGSNSQGDPDWVLTLQGLLAGPGAAPPRRIPGRGSVTAGRSGTPNRAIRAGR